MLRLLTSRSSPVHTISTTLSTSRRRIPNSSSIMTASMSTNAAAAATSSTVVVDDSQRVVVQQQQQQPQQQQDLQLHPIYPKLFTPYDLGPELGVLPNRIIMGSMHTGLEGHSMPGIMESFLNLIDKEGNDNDSSHNHSLDRMAMYFQRRALGGIGLMVTGGIAPNYEGWVGPFAAQLTTEQEMERHKIVTSAVHDVQIPIYGSESSSQSSIKSKIILQILHTGRYGYHPFVVSAETKKSPISPFAPKALTTSGIQKTINDFVNTASLARQAGYDGVEIMGSEGYLLSQFLSPRTNSKERTDKYGGESFENRSRFPLELVRAVRKHLGNDFIIIFRISLWELVENGMSWTETIMLANALKEEGVNILNTGIGWHESRIPTISTNVPRGAFTHPTKQLKLELESNMYNPNNSNGNNKIPAIVSTNRINAPDTAEDILQNNVSDLISMARPLLADPDFMKKAFDQKPETINTCIGCNQACLDHAFIGKTASCLVNPAACHETELDLSMIHRNSGSNSGGSGGSGNNSNNNNFTLPIKDRLNIGVIGAGPAGIAFACSAAEIGHNITLYERTNKIGGQFHMAKRVPGKEEFYEAIRYWENRIKCINEDASSSTSNGNGGKVQVELLTDMTVEDMTNLTTTGDHEDGSTITNIDKWVVSTGVIPRDIQIPGSDQFPDLVVSYVDVLRHNKPVGKRVAVIGAGGIGFDVSEFLLYGKQSDPDTITTTDTDTCPAAEVSVEDFWKEWGVDPTQEHRGGLAKDGPILPHGKPDRSIYLMQRKKGKVGGGLGKTTGWIHRASLNNSNQVTNIPGVQSYDKIDENGNLVYTDSKTGEQCILEVDTIVLCAGQLEERTLENGSKSISKLHDKVYPIGGAYQAGELDAKRAIDMGTRLAHKIHLNDVTPGNHVFHSSVGTEEKLFRFLKKWM